MEIQHLRYFIAIARELSFTKAAQGMFVSIPSLSRHIRSLEKELDISLFTRSAHQVSLTPAGERFLPFAKALVDDFDALREHVRGEDSGDLVAIRFAVHDLLHVDTQKSILAMVSFFSERYTFNIQQVPSTEMRQRLLNNSVDIVLSRVGIVAPELRSLFVKSEQAKVLAAVSVFPGKTSLRMKDFQGMTCVRVPPRFDLPEFQHAQRMFLEAGAKDGGVAQYSAIDGQLLALHAKDTFSLTLVGEDELRGAPNGSEFGLFSLKDINLDLSIVLAWRERDEQFSRAAAEIGEFLKSSFLA